LLVAILAPSCAIAGIIIGQLLSREAESKKWYRQELFQACSAFLAAVDSLRLFAFSVWITNAELGKPPNSYIEILKREDIKQAARDNMSSQLGRDPTEIELDQALTQVAHLYHRETIGKLGLSAEQAHVGYRESVNRVAAALTTVALLSPQDLAEAGQEVYGASIAYLELTPETENAAKEAFYSARNNFAVIAMLHLTQPSPRRALSSRRRKQKITTQLPATGLLSQPSDGS
jgi:hypothetical protein